MDAVRTILVPIDFSSHSTRALETAVGLAKTFGAEIHLLHCYSLNLGAVSSYSLAIPENFDRDVCLSAQAKLDASVEKVQADGIEVSSDVTQGSPGEAISSIAEDIGADLIVMGTRGLTGLKHVLLGSIAERTIRIAPCPVLTVKASGE